VHPAAAANPAAAQAQNESAELDEKSKNQPPKRRPGRPTDGVRRHGESGIFYKKRQNEKGNRALTKHLADQDPDRIVSVNEACRILGISRPTLYRHGGAMPRIRLSPGRVGDLLKFLRASAEKHGAATAAFEKCCRRRGHGLAAVYDPKQISRRMATE
jgi:hypothetical protein